MQNQERAVFIRRRLKQNHNCQREGICRHEQIELMIPSRYKTVIEPFLNKDLITDVRLEGNNLIVSAKPVEKS